MGDKQQTNAKMKQVIEQQIYLSDDFIIEEILTRLPVKSVLRFKSVSKQWYATLSSSKFASAHLIKSFFAHRSAPVNTLFIKNSKNYYLFSYDDDDDDQVSDNFEDNLVKLDVDNFEFQNYNAELTGSCNGLICLTIFSTKGWFFERNLLENPGEITCFILWNPATRKVHRYESDGFFKGTDNVGPGFVARGFGYASSVDDYKYIRILTLYCETKGCTIVIVHIFSLRENKWRKIDIAFDPAKFCPKGRAVLIDEKLYWEAVTTIEDSIVIVSFDLEVERFEIIQFNLHNFKSLLGVMGGCLSKWNNSKANKGDKVMHILESPTRVKSIYLPKELLLDTLSQMIGFTKTGKIFVTSEQVRDDRIHCQLQLLDIGRKPMQHSILLKFNNGLVNIAKYVPSLASPFLIDELP